MKCSPYTSILGNFGLTAFVLMSAYGYERTFDCVVIYVRFAPESGPFSAPAFMSASDPKRTFHRWIDRRRQERRFALSYASEEGELLDALENVVSYVPLLRGARAFSQA